MPKLKYEWVIIVACVGYMLNYEVFWSTVVSLMIVAIWNFFIDLPETFGYVRKEMYLEIQKEHEENKNKLNRLAAYINNINKTHVTEAEKSRIKDKATVDGQNAVFYVYLNDRAKFQYHLDEYIRIKVNNGRYSSKNNYKSCNKVDWRETLGVNSLANKENVDRVYKNLVRKYHPDVNKDPDAVAKMQSINEAKDLADKYFAKA